MIDVSSGETVLDGENVSDTRAPSEDERRRRPVAMLGKLVVALVLYLLIGNGLILGATTVARWDHDPMAQAAVSSIDNFRLVDERVWRGAAPDEQGLRELASSGVSTVVDLRAEHEPGSDDALFRELGLEKVELPVRDGQLPSAAQMAAFERIVDDADGIVFVHCGAGVGRSGAMVAHYLTASGEASAGEALWHNLSVGPPSLEQIAFALGSDGDGDDRPGPVVTGMSRVLDAPRRIWHNVF